MKDVESCVKEAIGKMKDMRTGDSFEINNALKYTIEATSRAIESICDCNVSPTPLYEVDYKCEGNYCILSVTKLGDQNA